jgi:hypothetical protein
MLSRKTWLTPQAVGDEGMSSTVTGTLTSLVPCWLLMITCTTRRGKVQEIRSRKRENVYLKRFTSKGDVKKIEHLF